MLLSFQTSNQLKRTEKAEIHRSQPSPFIFNSKPDLKCPADFPQFPSHFNLNFWSHLHSHGAKSKSFRRGRCQSFRGLFSLSLFVFYILFYFFFSLAFVDWFFFVKVQIFRIDIVVTLPEIMRSFSDLNLLRIYFLFSFNNVRACMDAWKWFDW